MLRCEDNSLGISFSKNASQICCLSLLDPFVSCESASLFESNMLRFRMLLQFLNFFDDKVIQCFALNSFYGKQDAPAVIFTQEHVGLL